MVEEQINGYGEGGYGDFYGGVRKRTYGAHDALKDVVNDLRDAEFLTSLLEAPEAISPGWPNDTQDYPVVVRVQPITETSSPLGRATQRTYRFQFSVVAKLEWRESKLQPTYEQSRIMHEVAERIDIAAGQPGFDPGEGAGGSWQEVSGDRLALIQDWQLTHRPIRQ